LRHLRVTRTVTKLRRDAKGDRAVEAELLEGFTDLMGWRSPETMTTYLKTMNKRQAIQAVLDDEEAQEQETSHHSAPPDSPSGQPELERNQELAHRADEEMLWSENSTDEFDWYEDEE